MRPPSNALPPPKTSRRTTEALDVPAEQQARGEVEALYRIAESVTSSQLDLNDVGQRVADEATTLIGAEVGAFFYSVTNEAGEESLRCWLAGAPYQNLAASGPPPRPPLFGLTLSGQTTVRLNDLTQDPRYATMDPHHGMPPGQPPMKSYLAVPVVAGGGPAVGGLVFGHSAQARFSERHERMMKTIALILAGAIENANRFRATRDTEDRQRRQTAELTETVRLNEIFAGALAHDLRTPLSAVMTATQLALVRTDSESQTRPLSRIMKSGARMVRMIEQMLDFASIRIEHGLSLDPRPLDLAPLVRDVVDELKAANPTASITVNDRGDTSGTWDGDRLAQVLSNLVGNAVQHGAPGEVVKITVDGSDREAVRVSVWNQGSMPETLLAGLFAPFAERQRRTERSRGLGLGLFITREITRAHGGLLHIDSTAGAGTTFEVFLPRWTRVASAAAQPLQPDASSPQGAHEQLRESEDRFRLLVATVRDYAIFMLDTEGRIQTWNAGAQAIQRYSAAEIKGRHVRVFYTPEDQAAGKPQALLERAAQDDRVEDEGWRVRKDGTQFWAKVVIAALRDARGRLSGFAEITGDHSERKRVEDRLRHSQERFRLLVESVKDYGIFILDPNGRVATWNPGAERMEGYRAADIIGQHFSILYAPADVQSGKCEQDLQAAAVHGRLEDEGWRLRKDGSRFWANVVITALREPQGELFGFANVTRDLTERRQQEEERIRLVHAEEAIRLRDEFLSIVSHELKTPLAGLQLQLEQLQRQMATTETNTTAQLRRATESGNRLASLIESLLDASHIATGGVTLEREEVDLARLVGRAIERARPSGTKAGCEIVDALPVSVPGFWDRHRLEQILDNLLSNAIKYGAGRDIEVSLRQELGEAILQVRDHGPGIPESDLERVFGRFERAVPIHHYGGMGLGLYVAREIAGAHGGRVIAENARGGGARIIVRLPAHSPPPTVAAPLALPRLQQQRRQQPTQKGKPQ